MRKKEINKKIKELSFTPLERIEDYLCERLTVETIVFDKEPSIGGTASIKEIKDILNFVRIVKENS